jgi:hypothetical protein
MNSILLDRNSAGAGRIDREPVDRIATGIRADKGLVDHFTDIAGHSRPVTPVPGG